MTDLVEQCFENKVDDPKRFIVKYLSKCLDLRPSPAECDLWQEKFKKLSAEHAVLKQTLKRTTGKAAYVDPHLKGLNDELAEVEQKFEHDLEEVRNSFSDILQRFEKGNVQVPDAPLKLSPSTENEETRFTSINQWKGSEFVDVKQLVDEEQGLAPEGVTPPMKSSNQFNSKVTSVPVRVMTTLRKHRSPKYVNVAKFPGRVHLKRTIKSSDSSSEDEKPLMKRLDETTLMKDLDEVPLKKRLRKRILKRYPNLRKRKFERDYAESSNGSDFEKPLKAFKIKRKRSEWKTFKPSSSGTSSRTESSEFNSEENPQAQSVTEPNVPDKMEHDKKYSLEMTCKLEGVSRNPSYSDCADVKSEASHHSQKVSESFKTFMESPSRMKICNDTSSSSFSDSSDASMPTSRVFALGRKAILQKEIDACTSENWGSSDSNTSCTSCMCKG